MNNLVLSIFPGAGLLDRGFTQAGYCVVCSGDPMFGQLGVESLHPPTGAFEGVIGGPPCQPFAQSHNLTGDRQSFENLIPEFERVVDEGQPLWFLMENVNAAPLPVVEGYDVQTQVIAAGEFGLPQIRRRRFSFGTKTGALLMWPRGEMGDVHHTFTTTSGPQRRRDGTRANGGKAFSIAQFCEGFGLEPDWDAPALTQKSKFTVLGNGVAIPVAKAIANAIRLSMVGV